jgi:hypothetical protein
LPRRTSHPPSHHVRPLTGESESSTSSAQIDQLVQRAIAETDRSLFSIERAIRALYDPRTVAQFLYVGLVTTIWRFDRSFALKFLELLPHGVGPLSPLLEQALKLSGGRRVGSLDPLDRVLVQILSADPRMSSTEVLRGLEKRAGGDIVLGVRKGLLKRAPGRGARRNFGLLVEWRHPETGREKATALSSIYARRLPRLRALVRRSQLSAQ